MDDWRHLERVLKDMSKKAIPYAVMSTINDMAFATRDVAIQNIKNTFTIRNTWTAKGIQVQRARRPFDWAETGSKDDYMRGQEFGEVRHKRGSVGVPIATTYSANQYGQPKRTKNVVSSMTLRRLTLKGKGKAKGKNPAQAAIVAYKGAKGGFFYAETQRSKGIFRALRNGARMVYDLSRRSVNIPARPWLEPAADRVTPWSRRIYASRLENQIARLEQLRLGRKK
jgi:hypothetical protein